MRKLLLIVLAVLLIAATVNAQDQTPEVTPEPTTAATQEMDATAEATMDATPEAGVAGNEATDAFVRFANFASDTTFEGDLADLEYGEISEWMVVEGGGSLSDYLPDMGDGQLQVGRWTTVIMTDDAVEMVVEDFANVDASMRPFRGIAQLTFVNGGQTDAILIRDEVPFFSSTAPVGDQRNSYSTLPVDAGMYTFNAIDASPESNSLGDLGEQNIVASNFYLIAVYGDGEILIDETTQAEVLMMRGLLEEPGTLVEAAMANPNLSGFAALLEDGDLSETLSGEGPYTLFVPANYILDDLDSVDAETLMNHVVEGDFKTTDFDENGSLTAAGGLELTITQEGNAFYVNGLQVIDANIAATNGTIHIINGVLQPEVTATEEAED